MSKRTVEIEDNLQELVEDIEYEIKENFISYLEENPGIKDFDEYYQSSGCDFVSEATDSNTPIYFSDIDGLYYLYGDEFDKAYKNAGIGDISEDNYRQVSIYCYLSEKGFDYLRKLEEKFEEREGINALIKELKEEE